MFHGLDLGATVAALCAAGDPAALPAILLALVAAGLFGGFVHCGPMCGPFVLMQVGEGDADGPVLRRLSGSLLPGYHLGRIVTYSALGAIAGGAGAALAALTRLHALFAILLALAALLFLLQAAKDLGLARLTGPPQANMIGQALVRRAGPLLGAANRSGRPRGLIIGLLLGFLPCGFLYGALAAAAATGTLLGGALAMAAFGLGTIPALAAVALVGTALAARWRNIAAAARPFVFLVNAVTLGSIALRLAI